MSLIQDILLTLTEHSETEMMQCGIYKITSKLRDKVYVGSAKKFKDRWLSHISALISKKHHNPHLQNHVNKYGMEDLKIEILDICEEKYLFVYEAYWINTLDTVTSGFNLMVPDMRLKEIYRTEEYYFNKLQDRLNKEEQKAFKKYVKFRKYLDRENKKARKLLGPRYQDDTLSAEEYKEYVKKRHADRKWLRKILGTSGIKDATAHNLKNIQLKKSLENLFPEWISSTT